MLELSLLYHLKFSENILYHTQDPYLQEMPLLLTKKVDHYFLCQLSK